MCSSDLANHPALGRAADLDQPAAGRAFYFDQIEVEGAAGGGLVKIRCSAKGRVIGVAIDDSLLVPADKGILEDLVAAAFNDARSKADAVSGAEMARMQQGMGLPPGFKLPGL